MDADATQGRARSSGALSQTRRSHTSCSRLYDLSDEAQDHRSGANSEDAWPEDGQLARAMASETCLILIYESVSCEEQACVWLPICHSNMLVAFHYSDLATNFGTQKEEIVNYTSCTQSRSYSSESDEFLKASVSQVVEEGNDKHSDWTRILFDPLHIFTPILLS